MVQWLGSGAFTAEGPGLVPGQGAKTPQAARPKEKGKKKLGCDYVLSHHLQSCLYFIRHFACPQSHLELTGILWGQIFLSPFCKWRRKRQGKGLSSQGL